MKRAYCVTMSGASEERRVSVNATSPESAARIAVRRTLYQPDRGTLAVLCRVDTVSAPHDTETTWVRVPA